MLESEKKLTAIYAIIEYWLYVFLVSFLCIFYHRFSSSTWFGYYPSSGLILILLFVNSYVAYGLKSAGVRLVRFFIPLLFVFIFINNFHSNDQLGLIENLQRGFSSAHVILIAIVTSAAIYFTSLSRSEKTNTLKVSQKLASPKPQTVTEDAFSRIIGQEHVIQPLKEISKMVSSGIRVGKKNAPHAVLLFLGPTGVGKTEAATALAEAVYGTKEAVVRFDMGQFTDSHQVSRFYGPPPGYAGYEEGGQLTRAVTKRPRAVILLDEVEKAHPQIWDAFLPVFDEGYIVDGSTNQKVDMTNTIIVLTSNLLAGRDDLFGKSAFELKEALQQTAAFRPELIGRINEILVFKALDNIAIGEILRRRVDASLWSLAEQGITISVDESDMQLMIEQVKAAKFGVRQIDDVVRSYLRGLIAKTQDGAL